MDGVRKQRKLKFKKIKKIEREDFAEGFSESDFLEKDFSQETNQESIQQSKNIIQETQLVSNNAQFLHSENRQVSQNEQVDAQLQNEDYFLNDQQISKNEFPTFASKLEFLAWQQNELNKENVGNAQTDFQNKPYEVLQENNLQADIPDNLQQLEQQNYSQYSSFSNSDTENNLNIEQRRYELNAQSEYSDDYVQEESESLTPAQKIVQSTDQQTDTNLKSDEEIDLQGDQNEFNYKTRLFKRSDNGFKSEKVKEKKTQKNFDFSLEDIFTSAKPNILMPQKVYTGFFAVVGIFVLSFGLFTFVGNAFAVKEKVMGAGERAIDSIQIAKDNIKDKDFQSSEVAISQAHQEFIFASEEMKSINSLAVFMSNFIPGTSQLATGKHIVEAGKFLTHAGQEINLLALVITDNIDSSGEHTLENVSLLKIYQESMQHVAMTYSDIQQAGKHIDKINLDDVPIEYRTQFLDMKGIVPHIEDSLAITVSGQEAIEDIFGANGPRKYLFLFQNNHEMRATGGFIGSYGLLEISNGKISNFKVEGIFNPDGQLIDRIVPPLPVQKISADWSLHDSNWFPNFPTSAEKAIDFYERTGGPTVDGVITITPKVMEEILAVTGPIMLEEYGTEVNSDNFMRVIQMEVEDGEFSDELKSAVEVGHIQSLQNEDGEDLNSSQETLNQQMDEEIFGLKSETSNQQEDVRKNPKKILADLTPMVFKELLTNQNAKDLTSLIDVFARSLDERHILIYMRNEYIQDVVSQNGWSGEVIQTDKDYLSVINSNINGFKTDGVVREDIEHSAEIHTDGSIINTVTITRKHEGGHTGFDWWDSVNADYMRVYVPKGARLLSVDGQTREVNEERLDYDTLGYERDEDIVKEENDMKIDDKSGTRIYDEDNKTVFANWVYVSPQETVRVTYKYILPFKADFDQDADGRFGSYAVVYQKQSGSENSEIKSSIKLADNFDLLWQTPKNKEDIYMKEKLESDLYHGVVFRVQ